MWYRLAALLMTIPLAAQSAPEKGPGGKWSLELYGYAPSLAGNYDEPDGTAFDLKGDFGLKSNSMGIGLNVGYMGPRFGISLGFGTEDFAGQNKIDSELKIGGESFVPGTELTSSLKRATFDLNWTIKVFRYHGAYVGVNLGAQAWSLDVKAKGSHASYPEATREASENVAVPIPQVGLAFGYLGLKDRLDLRGRANFLAYSGAKYMHFGAEARYYFLPWLGARASFENHSFDAPKGSIDEDTQAKLDSGLFGFGLALRW
jgi:hypothetical protein